MSAYAPYMNRSAEPGVVCLFCEFPVGASGAVGAFVRNNGFSKVVRNSTGDYTATLDTPCRAIMMVSGQIEIAASAAGAGDGTIFQLISRTPTATVATATPTINFRAWQSTTPATVGEIKSGCNVLLRCTVKRPR